MTSIIRMALSFGAVALVVALAGCGKSGPALGPTGVVEGQLTFAGKPLQPGTHVLFQHSQKGYLAFGRTNETGQFWIDSFNNGNLPVGSYEVTIQPALPKRDLDSIPAEELIDHPEVAKEAVVIVDFPKRYRDSHTSKLSFEVQPGDNQYDLALKPDPAAGDHSSSRANRDR